MVERNRGEKTGGKKKIEKKKRKRKREKERKRGAWRIKKEGG